MDDRFNRIFELARAAELIEWDELPSGALTPNHLSVARARKFAELIAKECMKCSEPLISHYIDTNAEQEQALLLASIADYSSEIKKHFGVEE